MQMQRTAYIDGTAALPGDKADEARAQQTCVPGEQHPRHGHNDQKQHRSRCFDQTILHGGTHVANRMNRVRLMSVLCHLDAASPTPDGSWLVTDGRRLSRRNRLPLIDPTQLATFTRSSINRLVTSAQRLRRYPPAAC